MCTLVQLNIYTLVKLNINTLVQFNICTFVQVNICTQVTIFTLEQYYDFKLLDIKGLFFKCFTISQLFPFFFYIFCGAALLSQLYCKYQIQNCFWSIGLSNYWQFKVGTSFYNNFAKYLYNESLKSASELFCHNLTSPRVGKTWKNGEHAVGTFNLPRNMPKSFTNQKRQNIQEELWIK